MLSFYLYIELASVCSFRGRHKRYVWLTWPLRSLSSTERTDCLIFASSNGAGGLPFVLLALHVLVSRPPLSITSVCACVRMWRRQPSSPELRYGTHFKLQPDPSPPPPPFFFLRIFRLGGVASCVLDFPLSDSSHGCPFSSDVVSARNVTGTAQEIHAGGETSNFVTPLQVCE